MRENHEGSEAGKAEEKQEVTGPPRIEWDWILEERLQLVIFEAGDCNMAGWWRRGHKVHIRRGRLESLNHCHLPNAGRVTKLGRQFLSTLIRRWINWSCWPIHQFDCNKRRHLWFVASSILLTSWANPETYCSPSSEYPPSWLIKSVSMVSPSRGPREMRVRGRWLSPSWGKSCWIWGWFFGVIPRRYLVWATLGQPKRARWATSLCRWATRLLKWGDRWLSSNSWGPYLHVPETADFGASQSLSVRGWLVGVPPRLGSGVGLNLRWGYAPSSAALQSTILSTSWFFSCSPPSPPVSSSSTPVSGFPPRSCDSSPGGLPSQSFWISKQGPSITSQASRTTPSV